MDGVENQLRRVSFPQGMWCGHGCTSILESLEGELAGQGGLVVITGAVGVGKSLLLDCYNKYLKKSEQTYYFMAAGELREVDFFNVLASGLSIPGLYTEKLQFIVELTNYLYSLAESDKMLTLVIDDCELLAQEILDVLRLIVQVEKNGKRLVQLILVGRRKFGQTLAQHRNASLVSNLIYNSSLEPFSQQETAKYIAYRLELAHYSTSIFGFNSLHLIHRATGGRVGDINRLCEHVLMQPLGENAVCYDVSALCNSIDALDMDMGAPDEDETPLPIVSKKIEQAPAKPKIHWEEAVQVAARKELGNGLQPIAGTETNVGLVQKIMASKSKKWWLLTGSSLVALCFYLVVPSVGSKQEQKTPESVVQQNRLLHDLVTDDVVSETTGDVLAQEKTETRAKGEPRRSKMSERAPFLVEAEIVDVEPAPPIFSLEDDVAVEPKSPPVPMQISEPLSIAQEEVAEVATPVEVAAVEEEVLLPQQPFIRVMRLKAGTNGLAGGAATSLQEFLVEAKSFPQAQIVVKGYVSSDNVSQENTEISVKRATVIQNMLVAKGIEVERIRVVGMGVQSPVASNATVSGRNKNRRVVLELLSKEYTKSL